MSFEQDRKQALVTVGNIGFAKAAASLSVLLQKDISIRIPEVAKIFFEDIVQAIADADETQVVVFLRVEGDTPGKVAIFFPIKSAEYIIKTLFANSKEVNLYEDLLAHSALQEVGNIMVSSFLTALSDHTGLRLLPSTPAIAIDMAGAIIDAILVEDGILDDEVLLMSTIFEGSTYVQGQLVFFPNAGSLTKLIGALKL